jgi:RNA polymerase sigma factor (sigma-70 family)
MAVHPLGLLTRRPAGVSSEDVSGREEEAFAEALLAATRLAFRTLRAVGLSPDDAADALQDAAIRAWRHRAQRRGDFLPWFVAIAYREARRPHRVWATMPAFWRGAADAQAHSGRNEDLDEALALLPRRQRTALSLRYDGDLSIAGVAGVMRISEPAAKQLLSRARDSLRRTMSSEPRGEP